MLCALIMAGGRGTRFWPLSTEKKPKQFLKLLSNDTMVQMTVKRLLPIIPIERIFIVTSEEYVDIVKEQLPYLRKENIILEPVGRNTAPCIALSAFHINKLYEDATMIVVPSDHLISYENKFLKIVEEGKKYIESNNKAIVTLGITPTRAETGYGYIKCKENNSDGIIRVEAFVEKPQLELAKKYVESKKYLWNSGIFMWKCSNILKLMQKYLTNTYNILAEIAISSEDDYNNELKKKYTDVDNISIDFAIMEKADNIYVIPADMGWDDIGSWESIERYGSKDHNGNIIIGNVRKVRGKNNIIIGNNKPIVVLNDDVLFVESEDLIFICNRDNIDKAVSIREELNL